MTDSKRNVPRVLGAGKGTVRVDFPVADLRSCRTVGRCHNLRMGDDGALHGVGRPAPHALTVRPGAGAGNASEGTGGDAAKTAASGPVAPELFKPELLPGAFSDGSGRVLTPGVWRGALVLFDGRRVYTLGPVDEGVRPTVLWCGGKLWATGMGGPPRCYGYDAPADEWRCDSTAGAAASLVPMRIERLDMGVESAAVGSLTLGGTYTHINGQLTAADQLAVDSLVKGAYTRLVDQALAHGQYIQPVMARYNLYTPGGELLYSSPYVVAGQPEGLQGVVCRLSLSGDRWATCACGSLTATRYSLRAVPAGELPPGWDALVGSVQLQVMPQLHPLAASTAGHSRRVTATAQGVTLDTWLPGYVPDQAPALPGSMLHRVVADLLECGYMPPTPVAEGACACLADELARLASLRETAAARRVPGRGELWGEIAAGGNFTATCAAANGQLVAWGGLRTVPFDGYELPQVIAAIAPAATAPAASGGDTWYRVDLEGGSGSVQRRTYFDKGRIDALSPLLYYPSARAVRAVLRASGKRLEVALSPTPGRGCAMWLDPWLRPAVWDGEDDMDDAPLEPAAGADWAGMVMIASSVDPLRPLAVADAGVGNVTALLPAVRQTASFAVPSARFYVCGAGGIATATLSDSQGSVRTNLIDPRGVEGAGGVTLTPRGIAAVAGGRLIEVSGARSAALGAGECAAGSMAVWCSAHGEVWVIPPGDGGDVEVKAVNPATGARHTLSLPAVQSVSTTPVSLLLSTHVGVVDGNREEDAAGPVRAEYSVRVPWPQKCGALHVLLEAGLYGRGLGGEVVLSCSHGHLSPSCMALARIGLDDASPVHPLCCVARAAHCHSLQLDVNVTTHSPSSLALTCPRS